MEKDEIVAIPKKEEYVSVEKNSRRQKKRLKRGFVRFLLLVAIFLVAFMLIRHFKEIKGLVEGIFDKELQTNNQVNLPNSDEKSDDENEENSGLIDERIPEGSYQILDTGLKKYVFTNESGCDLDLNKELNITKVSEVYKKYGNEAPLVLITSTHLRESYSNGKYYSSQDNFYSDSNNVGELGKIIAEELNSQGINTILLSELYASGSILNSRDEYEKSLEQTLKKYPSISYVFNISRGLYIKDDMTMDKSCLVYNGQKSAQISLINGTNSNSVSQALENNIAFAHDFYKFSFEKSPNLVHENKISRFPLSQDITPFCCEVEIGTYANSFDEAQLGAITFVSTLSEYLFSKE